MAMFGAALISTNVAAKPKQADADVRTILRHTKANSAAMRAAEEMGLQWSIFRITSFNDLEPPSVGFSGFNLSATLKGSRETRDKFPGEVARRIARLLKDAGATGGNLATYLAPDASDLREPRIHYVKGNIQGFVVIQMGKTNGASEVFFLVCYEHLKAEPENAQQDGAEKSATDTKSKSEANEKAKPETEGRSR